MVAAAAEEEATPPPFSMRKGTVIRGIRGDLTTVAHLRNLPPAPSLLSRMYRELTQLDQARPRAGTEEVAVVVAVVVAVAAEEGFAVAWLVTTTATPCRSASLLRQADARNSAVARRE